MRLVPDSHLWIHRSPDHFLFTCVFFICLCNSQDTTNVIQPNSTKHRGGAGHWSGTNQSHLGEHISPLLVSLHRLPVKSSIEFKIRLIPYEALNVLAPSYLKDLSAA